MEPIPDRLVVLTFDDGRRSDVEFVGPLLSRRGFGATFYVTEGLGFEDKTRFLDWDEIRWLHDAGFEIGNHHGRHVAVSTQTRGEFERDLRRMERSCLEHGIPRPVTYCYPGGHHCRAAVDALHDAGYLFARRCTAPEHVDHADGAFGRAYAPGRDHPLLIPCAGIGGAAWDLDDLRAAVSAARDGRIAVICLHGVPDDHRFCSTAPELFERFADYLAERDYTVIAVRDLARYVDPRERPADPYAPIRARLCVRARGLACERAAGGSVRFRWALASDQRGQRQTAYRILAASARELLTPGRADLWDSGTVESADPSVIGDPPDPGGPPAAGRPAGWPAGWWTVRCWDAGGRAGPWAAPVRLQAAPPSAEPLTDEWIGAAPASLGITPEGVGTVRIRPPAADGARQASGSAGTARGRIAVSWERAEQTFALQVTLPPGVDGRVTVPTLGLPAFRIDEHGGPVWGQGSARAPRPWRMEGIRRAEAAAGGDGVTFDVGSGDYRFTVSPLAEPQAGA